MSQDLATLLGQTPLLSGLPAVRLQALAEAGVPRVVRARETLYSNADSNHLYLLHHGRIRLHVPLASGDFFLHLCGPGEIAGMEKLYDDPLVVDAVALEVAGLTAFPVDHFWSHIADYAPACRRLAELNHTMAASLLDRLTDMSSCPVQERLIRFLLRQTRKYGQENGHGALLLDIGMSHHDLASSVGTSRETVTTLLNGLKRDGYLDIGRKTITLRQPDKLQRLANGGLADR